MICYASLNSLLYTWHPGTCAHSQRSLHVLNINKCILFVLPFSFNPPSAVRQQPVHRSCPHHPSRGTDKKAGRGLRPAPPTSHPRQSTKNVLSRYVSLYSKPYCVLMKEGDLTRIAKKYLQLVPRLLVSAHLLHHVRPSS